MTVKGVAKGDLVFVFGEREHHTLVGAAGAVRGADRHHADGYPDRDHPDGHADRDHPDGYPDRDDDHDGSRGEAHEHRADLHRQRTANSECGYGGYECSRASGQLHDSAVKVSAALESRPRLPFR